MVGWIIRKSAYAARRLYLRAAGAITMGCRALVIDNGHVLLVRHSYQAGWFLPGGGVDRGESLRQSMERELLEECALRVEKARLVSMFFSQHEGRSDHIALFLVERFTVASGRTIDPEIAEARFFPLTALPEGTSAATRRRINEFCDGLSSPDGW